MTDIRTRRARGEIPQMILRTLNDAEPGARFTPYALAQRLSISPGSATAAVKRLVQQEKIRMYGDSPLVIGSL